MMPFRLCITFDLGLVLGTRRSEDADEMIDRSLVFGISHPSIPEQPFLERCRQGFRRLGQ